MNRINPQQFDNMLARELCRLRAIESIRLAGRILFDGLCEFREPSKTVFLETIAELRTIEERLRSLVNSVEENERTDLYGAVVEYTSELERQHLAELDWARETSDFKARLGALWEGF